MENELTDALSSVDLLAVRETLEQCRPYADDTGVFEAWQMLENHAAILGAAAAGGHAAAAPAPEPEQVVGTIPWENPPGAAGVGGGGALGPPPQSTSRRPSLEKQSAEEQAVVSPACSPPLRVWHMIWHMIWRRSAPNH